MQANPFKSRLKRQQDAVPLLGSWVMSAAPSTAEALGFCGFDFLVIDMEHTPIGIGETITMLRAVAGTPAQSVVRLAWNDQILVKQVLDAGGRHLMFPFVQSAHEASQAVAFTRYPPHGVRGVAAVHRASQFGRMPDYLKQAESGLTVIIQLETPEAIDRLEEIAAVPGVDALFVGPGDLSAALGLIGQIGHDRVQELIALAAHKAARLGMPIGIVGPNPEMVKRFLDYGYDWVAVASDLGMMTGRAVEWVAAVRGSAQVAAPTAAY